MASVAVESPSSGNPQSRPPVVVALDLPGTDKRGAKISPAVKKATKASYRRSLSLDTREIDQLKESQGDPTRPLNDDATVSTGAATAATSAPNSPRKKRLSNSSPKRKKSPRSTDQHAPYGVFRSWSARFLAACLFPFSPCSRRVIPARLHMIAFFTNGTRTPPSINQFLL
jgi:hypothetical protein